MYLRLFIVGLLLSAFALPVHADGTMGERVQACAACHGDNGRSTAEAYYPSIAGKPEGYLYRQLKNFQTGRRPHRIMQNMLAYLSDDYLREIAAWYASQPPSTTAPLAAAPADKLELGQKLATRGDADRKLPACTSCHAPQLQGITPDIPGLTGLRAEYLSAQLGAWQADTRSAPQPDCMQQIAQMLTGDEIDALSQWIASRPYAGKPAPASALPDPLPLTCGAVQ